MGARGRKIPKYRTVADLMFKYEIEPNLSELLERQDDGDKNILDELHEDMMQRQEQMTALMMVYKELEAKNKTIIHLMQKISTKEMELRESGKEFKL